MKYFVHLLLTVSAIQLLGCTMRDTYADVVLQRAVFDFWCDYDKIDVQHIDGNMFWARGCGQRAIYICYHSEIHPATCALNSTDGVVTERDSDSVPR
ncbi:MAG: hypothetical protein FWD57_02520 [Polyangiaceae bacterium]|nr:hypothetical protein [Polyangiaceae bacterium]